MNWLSRRAEAKAAREAQFAAERAMLLAAVRDTGLLVRDIGVMMRQRMDIEAAAKVPPLHEVAQCPECGRKDGFVPVRQESSVDPARLSVKLERLILVCQGTGKGEHAIEMTRSGLRLHKPPLVDREPPAQTNGEPEGVDTDLPGLYRRR